MSGPVGGVVVDLDAVEATDRGLVGGKATGLRLLRAAGLPCPPGVVVTTRAHRRYLDAAVGADRLAEVAGRPSDDTQAWRAVREAHDRHAVPPAIAGPLGRAVAGLTAPDGFAVRSSAVWEDGSGLAFAGVYESVLGVAAGDVERAVRACWASLWSPAAVAYPSGTATPVLATGMAVVVQPMLRAAAAAVVFTTDPVGDPALVRVEAVHGAGAALVGGDADPEVFLFDRVTLRAVEARRTARSDGDPRCGREFPLLAVPLLRRLAELTLRAERAFGLPLDVEAVLVDVPGGDARWELVQARPVTATGGAARVGPRAGHGERR